VVRKKRWSVELPRKHMKGEEPVGRAKCHRE
jgi:hypothetical protein